MRKSIHPVWPGLFLILTITVYLIARYSHGDEVRPFAHTVLRDHTIGLAEAAWIAF